MKRENTLFFILTKIPVQTLATCIIQEHMINMTRRKVSRTTTCNNISLIKNNVIIKETDFPNPHQSTLNKINNIQCSIHLAKLYYNSTCIQFLVKSRHTRTCTCTYPITHYRKGCLSPLQIKEYPHCNREGGHALTISLQI